MNLPYSSGLGCVALRWRAFGDIQWWKSLKFFQYRRILHQSTVTMGFDVCTHEPHTSDIVQAVGQSGLGRTIAGEYDRGRICQLC
jgi:hypothetical protein